MTPLAQAIQAVDAGRSEPTVFYDVFLLTALLVPVDAETMAAVQGAEIDLDDEISILVVEAEEGPLVPTFDTPEKLREWAGQDMPFISVKGHVLVDLLDDDLQIAINPNTESSKLIDRSEISDLRRWVDEGLMPGETTSGPARITAVSEIDPDLDSALLAAFEEHGDIKQAYLLAALEDGAGEGEAYLLIVLETESAGDAAFQSVAKDIGIAIRPYIGEEEFFEIYRFEPGRNVSDAITERGFAPYFKR